MYWTGLVVVQGRVYAGNYVNHVKLVNLVNQGKLVKLVNFGKLLNTEKLIRKTSKISETSKICETTGCFFYWCPPISSKYRKVNLG